MTSPELRMQACPWKGLVGSTVLVGVGVGDGVEPTAPSGSPIAVGTVEGFEEGLGVGIVTPLFHTNFLPLLIHVYFLPM